jgi:hypothetical protein
MKWNSNALQQLGEGILNFTNGTFRIEILAAYGTVSAALADTHGSQAYDNAYIVANTAWVNMTWANGTITPPGGSLTLTDNGGGAADVALLIFNPNYSGTNYIIGAEDASAYTGDSTNDVLTWPSFLLKLQQN